MCMWGNLPRSLWLSQHDVVNGLRKKKMPLQDQYFWVCIVQANLEQLEILCAPVHILQPQTLCRMPKRDKGNLTSTSSLSENGNHIKENLLSVLSVPKLLIHTLKSQNTSKRTIPNLDTSVGTFRSSSWKYQHQNRHKGLCFKCSIKEYGKLFQFKYQLDDHKRKHTGKALYVCSTRDCLKGFTTKRAHTYHEKKHNLEGRKDFVIMLKMGRFVAKIFNGKNYLSSTSMDISERSWWHTVEKVITGRTLVNITKIVVIHAKQKWKRTHLSISLMSNKQNCGHSTTCFRNIK